MVEKRTIYHRNGDHATLPSVDCNDAVHLHPDEWSYRPWTCHQKSLGSRDPTIAAYTAVPARRT